MRGPWYILVLGGCFWPQEVRTRLKAHEQTARNLADSDDVAVLGPVVEISGPEGVYLDAIRATIPKLPGRVKLTVGNKIPGQSSGHLDTEVTIDAQSLTLPHQTRQRGTLEVAINYQGSAAAAISTTVGKTALMRLLEPQPKQAAIPARVPPAMAVAVSSRFGRAMSPSWAWAASQEAARPTRSARSATSPRRPGSSRPTASAAPSSSMARCDAGAPTRRISRGRPARTWRPSSAACAAQRTLPLAATCVCSPRAESCALETRSVLKRRPSGCEAGVLGEARGRRLRRKQRAACARATA